MINFSTRLLLFSITVVAVALLRVGGLPAGAQYLQYGQAERTSQSRRTTAQTTAGQTRRVLAIRNVTVITGTGAEPIRNATVLIRDERIVAIGPAAETVVPTDARVIEGAGKFLLPGFIEMHAHISKTRSSALGLFVANGVTTVRDTGREP